MAEQNPSTNTVVLMLNAKGDRELYCGWRVQELFRGEWNASADEIAMATGRKLGARLQVHAQIDDDDGRNIVLRWSTAYAFARPAPAMVRRLEVEEEPTRVRSRARKPPNESGTFPREIVTQLERERGRRTA